MDGIRFDEFARAVARGRNRRDVLKGLAAGLAAWAFGAATAERGAAQQNVPLGGRCSAFGANEECSQAGTPAGGVAVICSDNGIARDGSYNCCRNSGGVCSEDYHCCGAAFCTNGFCGGSGSSSGTSGNSGTTSGGLALGAECTSTSQCSQSGGSVVCADNGVAGDGARNCCRNQGGACTSDLNCCASYYCVNGVCGGESSSTSNLPLGAECTETSQCSQTGGSVVCASNGIVADGELNCCRNEGGPCVGLETSADCCGGLYCREGTCQTITRDGGFVLGAPCTSAEQCSQEGGAVACADNGIATDGELNCCRYTGGACTGDIGCCAGLMCVNGVCAGAGEEGVTGGLLPPGAACSSRDQCSQEGGATTCGDNGIASDGELNCCRVEGGPCADSAGCCYGLECVGGVCSAASAQSVGGMTPAEGATGGLPLGAACTSDEQCSQEGGEVACRDNGLPGDGERNCCRYRGGACTGDAACCIGLMCVDGVCQG